MGGTKVPCFVTGVPLGRSLVSDSLTHNSDEVRVRSWNDNAWTFVAWEPQMSKIIRQLWNEEQGQDVAEYAVMLAVILVIVIGTVRLIGGNANNVFSQVSSQMAQ